MLNSLNEKACRLAACGIRSPSCACVAMTQQLHTRAYLYQVLRRANSWVDVFDPISANRFTLIANEEDVIAADPSAELVFSLRDCGHSRLVFEERLGHFPASPTSR